MKQDEREAPSRLYRLFPFLDWLKGYQLKTFKDDSIAGITVAVVLIPQAMAYAMLAGMPAVYGLYAAAVTPFIAALWGSLRQLATGPIAIMSLLVLTTLSSMAEPGSQEFIELAFLLAMMVGILYFLIGINGNRYGVYLPFSSKGFYCCCRINYHFHTAAALLRTHRSTARIRFSYSTGNRQRFAHAPFPYNPYWRHSHCHHLRP